MGIEREQPTVTLARPTLARPMLQELRSTAGESRRHFIRRFLTAQGLDAIVCTLPTNVLMLTGCWPVVGATLVVATRTGRIVILAPQDEEEFARAGWADDVHLFEAGSLEDVRTTVDVVTPLLEGILAELGLQNGQIGCESGRIHEPASYVSMYLYGGLLREMLERVHDTRRVRECDDLLERLRTLKTPDEVRRIRYACEIAGRAFEQGKHALRVGQVESAVANAFRDPLSTLGLGYRGTRRADGFTFCMSGPNAATAFRAFGCTRTRILSEGDLVMIHADSHADGYWTGITRTYSLGPLDEQKRRMFRAVFDARCEALDMIRPGVQARAIDAAVRGALARHGFGDSLKHPTGHGVGFGSIDNYSRPFVHPRSSDVLETGMVFNVEPAVYVEGYGGVRHCDVVVVNGYGVSVLTPFHVWMEDLVLR